MNTDLRAFLQTLREESPDDLWEIDTTVSLNFEMTAYAMELERRQYPPALLFTHVDGFTSPVLSNLFASRKRIARMLGLQEQELVSHWSTIAHRRIKPGLSSVAPVKQVITKGSEVNLWDFPIPVHFETDAGRYISGGVIIAKDPDTGTGNLNFSRLQVKGPAKLGASLHSRGDLWNFQKRQEANHKALEVAVAIGVHPAISIAAATQLPITEDELELAGGLMSAPVPVIPAETVDLMVPAEAEMVLEGCIEPDAREDEGPFNEYTGYSTHRSTRHILHVTAITHRQDMIFQDIVPGNSSEHLNLSKTSRVPRVFDVVKRTFSNVTAIHYPFSGTHFHCYLSMKDPLPGQARQAMLLLFGLDMYLKLVVVVNDDVDITNEQEVLWALATRFQADKDLFIVDGVSCNLLDPSAHEGVAAKLGLDATRSPDFSAVRMSLPDSVLQKARDDIAAWTSRTAHS
jgi:4-hydroxy-3-polyprenylbenzoate decarboxylase